jgi:hypothetical protein
MVAADVSFWHKADILIALANLRFGGKADIRIGWTRSRYHLAIEGPLLECPLGALKWPMQHGR